MTFAAAWLDSLAVTGRLAVLPFFKDASPAGARAVLATVAGSSMSVAGLVFSISMVVLSTVSTQLGPRLLPNFFHRKSTQLVLGVFMGTFVAALLVLVQLTDAGPESSSHSYAIALSVALAVLSVALLVYFLHSMTTFIQVPRVIEEVGRHLTDALMRETGAATTAAKRGGTTERAITARFESGGASAIQACSGGYVQALDIAGALRIAAERDIYVMMMCRPGQYVPTGGPLAMILPVSRTDDKIADAFRNLFVIGIDRNDSQDVEFALDQLVEIAVRALSPGINDPFTALNCIDRLGDALLILAEREFPANARCDEAGVVRVLVVGYADEGILDAAFNPLRQHGCRNVAISIRLLEIIAQLGKRATREDVRRGLSNHLERIREAYRREITGEEDLKDIEERYIRALQVLACGRSGSE
jgi:uncharacterized membrane protein